MFHVLEHILDPIGFLEKASAFLKESGLIVVEVPNYNAYMKKYSEGYNSWTYPRGHLSNFTPKSLCATLNLAGFGDVSVYGKQIYSVENAIHWARNNAPFMQYPQFELPEGLEFVNDWFKEKMETDLTSDALVVVGAANI